MTRRKIDAMLQRLLLNACLVFTTAIAKRIIDTSKDSTVNCPNNESALFYVEPVHYNIKLTLYNETFEGESDIHIKVLTFTIGLQVHAENLQIDFDTILLFKYGKKRGKGKRPQHFTYCKETQILDLEFHHPIEIGEYNLTMNFEGSLLESRGLFVATKHMFDKGKTRQSYVTLFEQTGARSVFPCWDDSKWTSAFNISIVHSNIFRAWSNMPILKKSMVTYETIMTQFETTPYIPVYYLTIALIEVESVYLFYKDPIRSNISMWCAPNTTDDLKLTEAVVPLIDHVMNKDMQFTWKGPAINFIVFPNLPTKFTGNWATAIVRQEYIIDKGISVGNQIEVQRKVAHTIGRHYIESFNIITRGLFEWFRKGLALYFSYDIMTKSRLYNRMEDLFVVQVTQPALRNDIALNVPSVKNNYDPIYSSLINEKASVIIRMLKYTIQTEKFDRGLVDYFKLNHSVTPKNLWKYFSYTFPKKYNKLENIVYNWISQPKYLILYLAEYENGDKYIKQNSNQTNDESIIWMMPLTYTTQTELNFSDTSPKLWFTGIDIDLPRFDLDEWVIFNIQQTGFYRINYDKDNWLKLAYHLKERDHTEIHYLNRAQIIDDAYHFMMAQELDHEIFRMLIDYLWKEQQYTPWHSMMNILYYTSPFFGFSESQSFKDHVLNILTKYLTNPVQPSKTKVLATRLLILHWACKLGDHECRKMANSNLTYYLNNSNNTIRPGLEDWTYCAGLMTADNKTWISVAKQFIARNQTTAMLKYLACTEDKMTVMHFLQSIIPKISDIWTQVEPEDLVILYRGIMKQHIKQKEVFNFVLENIRSHFPNLLTMNEKLGSIIMNIYSKCQLSEVWDFVRTNFTQNKKLFEETYFMIDQRNKQLLRQKHMFLGPFNVIENDDDPC